MVAHKDKIMELDAVINAYSPNSQGESLNMNECRGRVVVLEDIRDHLIKERVLTKDQIESIVTEKKDVQISKLMNHCDNRAVFTDGNWCHHPDRDRDRICTKMYCPILKE